MNVDRRIVSVHFLSSWDQNIQHIYIRLLCSRSWDCDRSRRESAMGDEQRNSTPDYNFTLSPEDADVARRVATGHTDAKTLLSPLAAKLMSCLEGPNGLVVVRRLLDDEHCDAERMGKVTMELCSAFGELLPQSKDLRELVGEVTQHDRTAYGKPVYRG